MSRHSTVWDPAIDPDAPDRGFNPPQTQRLWRDQLLPRLIIPVFWIYWAALLPAGMVRRRLERRQTVLAIESGRVGWTHVYFEELLASAREHLSTNQVERVEIDRDAPYLPQFRRWTANRDLTHALLDVRTGPQTWPRALASAFVVAWRLRRRSITPIVVLTDASLRRHRLQAAAITAHSGIVITFMSDTLVAPMFPHARLLGPMPMPVSASRLEALRSMRAAVPAGADATISFIGGDYRPRTQFLARLSDVLKVDGIDIAIHANKYATSNDEYWRVLATSDIILTTTMQGMPRADLDWVWIKQLVFRFSEALSAGAVLVAQEVPGSEQFFVNGDDFLSFVSVEDARAALVMLVSNSGERERIRAHGLATATRLALEHRYWRVIDERLGGDALASAATLPAP